MKRKLVAKLCLTIISRTIVFYTIFLVGFINDTPRVTAARGAGTATGIINVPVKPVGILGKFRKAPDESGKSSTNTGAGRGEHTVAKQWAVCVRDGGSVRRWRAAVCARTKTKVAEARRAQPKRAHRVSGTHRQKLGHQSAIRRDTRRTRRACYTARLRYMT